MTYGTFEGCRYRLVLSNAQSVPGATGVRLNDRTRGPKKYTPSTPLGDVLVKIKSVLERFLKKKSLFTFDFGGCCWTFEIPTFSLWLAIASGCETEKKWGDKTRDKKNEET